MEMIIAVLIISGCILLSGIVYGQKPMMEKRRIVRMKTGEIERLLHNIDIYDGSSKGQKKVGGDKL